MKKDSLHTGLKQNQADTLAYVIFWVSGLMMLFVEPKNKSVQLHAWQSIILFGSINALLLILWFLAPPSEIVFILSLIILLGGFAAWIYLMVETYLDKIFVIPLVSDFAKKIIK